MNILKLQAYLNFMKQSQLLQSELLPLSVSLNFNAAELFMTSFKSDIEQTIIDSLDIFY